MRGMRRVRREMRFEASCVGTPIAAVPVGYLYCFAAPSVTGFSETGRRLVTRCASHAQCGAGSDGGGQRGEHLGVGRLSDQRLTETLQQDEFDLRRLPPSCRPASVRHSVRRRARAPRVGRCGGHDARRRDACALLRPAAQAHRQIGRHHHARNRPPRRAAIRRSRARPRSHGRTYGRN